MNKQVKTMLFTALAVTVGIALSETKVGEAIKSVVKKVPVIN